MSLCLQVLQELYEAHHADVREKAYPTLNPKLMALMVALKVKLVPLPGWRSGTAYGTYDSVTDEVAAQDVRSDYGCLESYMCHELIHWTGHPDRLHRFKIGDGRHTVTETVLAQEEMTAQYGMMLLMGFLGLPTEPFWIQHSEFKYRWSGYDPQKALEDAYRALGYIRMMSAKAHQPEPQKQPLEAITDDMAA